MAVQLSFLQGGWVDQARQFNEKGYNCNHSGVRIWVFHFQLIASHRQHSRMYLHYLQFVKVLQRDDSYFGAMLNSASEKTNLFYIIGFITYRIQIICSILVLCYSFPPCSIPSIPSHSVQSKLSCPSIPVPSQLLYSNIAAPWIHGLQYVVIYLVDIKHTNCFRDKMLQSV